MESLDDEFLFAPDVAKKLGLSVETVWNYVGNPGRCSRLPPFSRSDDAGRERITWKKRDVDAWIDAARQSVLSGSKRRPGRPTNEQRRAAKEAGVS
jgi:predicted DNA-binding transcriptional regulator AlpA